MKTPRNPDRLIRTYLQEDQAPGQPQVPDHVYNAIRDGIEQTRQRAVIGSMGVPVMNKFVGVVAATAIVAAAVMVGLTVSGGGPFIGGAPGLSPSAEPSTAPSEAPSPSSVEPSSPGDGSLPVGPHVMDPVHPTNGNMNEDRVTVTIPAPGWFAGPDEGSVTKDLGGDNRATVVVVPGDIYTMPPNICNWQIDDADLRANLWPNTADEFAAYLAEQTYDTPDGSLTREFSAPEDITIDGSHGQRIMDVVREYPDSDPNPCDEQRFCTVQDRDRWGCLLSHPEPGALDTLWVVDPPRNYLLVVASSGSPNPGLRAEMNTLVNSMTFSVE